MKVRLATISKHLTFDASHFLLHPGKTRDENIKTFHKCCLYKSDGTSEPHGHTYHLTVFVTGFVSEDDGYIIDFKDLKRILKDGVIERLDHRLINNIPWFKNTLTTVENIMHYIWEEIQPQIDALRPEEAWLQKIEMYETPNSSASYDRHQWIQEQYAARESNDLKAVHGVEPGCTCECCKQFKRVNYKENTDGETNQS